MSAAEYQRAHARLHSARGSARDHLCVWCWRGADQWAYVGTMSGLNPHGPPEDYQPMCRGCHRQMDAMTRRTRKRHPADVFLW